MTKSHKAILALIIANIIWGAASPIFKWSLENIQPFTLAFFRFAIGALIILPFAIKALKIEKKDLMSVIGLSIAGITLNIPFFFFGLKYTASINAPIITSASPIFIILLSIPILKEKPKKIKLAGALLGLLGIIVIFLKPIIEGGINLSIIGNLFLIVATFAAIAQTIITKIVIKNYSAVTISFWSFAIGALTFLPAFIYEVYYSNSLANINSKGIIGIVFGAVFCTVIAYYCFNWALKYLPASEVSLFSYLDPVVAIIIAIPLLGEIPTMTYIAGATLVFLGIYAAEGRLPYFHFKKHTEVIQNQAVNLVLDK